MGENYPSGFYAHFFSAPPTMKPEFDAARTPLEKGFTVIEASAGTGKTTTISAIVLRLIAEHGIPIEKILVATYTELATAELRGRIRQVIVDAAHCARGGAAKSTFVEAIVGKIADRTELAQRLELARHNFDQAPVFTIHGFCARVLADRAFESGVLFDTELTIEQSHFLHEVADDFWRAHFYTDDALMAAVVRGRITPAQLVNLLEQLTNNPTLRVLPPPENLAALKNKIAELWAKRRDSGELAALADRFVVALQAQFCHWGRAELPRRKMDRRLQSFDDMLTRLDAALRSPRGQQLRKNLRERFSVALIDEFQDTDPVQYSIFSQIYRDGDASVFFIGDPKQAIYGFRGADVFTYLHAAEAANRRYTLAKNWRSEAKLVDGVNAIFGLRDTAFVIPGIGLVPVSASGTGDADSFTINEQRDQPLRFWVATAGDRTRRAGAVAGEIANLLAGNARIGGKKIKPRHIAVLVTNNAQPAEIQNALADYRIPSVVYSAANVFKSREATELMLVLLGAAQPSRETIVRAALATEILGLSANALECLSGDEGRWEETLNRFANYQAEWRDGGFVKMMRAFIVREGVRSRLLCLIDGERRLTNLLHLIELLHAACAQNRFGIDGLIGWLRRQISDAGETKEEYELRLESDADAVRIVTIHKSKGLEYDIIFCPFVRREPWRGGKEFLKFHDDDELVLDLAESEENKTVRDREELAESVRQLYVALTRARHRSYVVWQESKQRSKSALAWLLSEETSADKFLKRGASTTTATARSAFAGSNAIVVEDLPERDTNTFVPVRSDRPVLEPRIFDGEIDRNWGIASFSSLVSGKTREPETPDYDSTETLIETEPLAPAQGIHAFPGGTRAGTCLHKILEELDFCDPTQWPSLISAKLKQFHISGFDEVVFGTVARLLETPLAPAGFGLREVSMRVPELEFTFPINVLKWRQLQELFEESDFPKTIGRLEFFPVSGFMKGFVDLVFEHGGKFYFADWKSNWLGPDASFYTRQNLDRAMVENFYTLQLSIYALALHRYLGRRLPAYNYEKNFGGAFYIFLRGNDGESRGIFHSRPRQATIEKLDRIFHGNA
jgi:exodeoxyribonuclease V beta subunit